MSAGFEWREYNLGGPPVISLNDYTFRAFGCTRLLESYLSSIKEIRSENLAVRWMFLDYWGRGKSTLAYNLCFKINETMFFSNESKLTLALFTNQPQRPEDLLDYTYQNGLPIPWKNIAEKGEVSEQRSRLFTKAIRLLAVALLIKAIHSKSENPSKLSRLISLVDANKLKIETPLQLLEHLDCLHSNQVYETSKSLLADYFDKQALGEFEQDISLNYFSSLLYPENSTTFLFAFSYLFARPKSGLRNFLTFRRLCEAANIHLLLIIDEAAEWDQVIKCKLDDFLIEQVQANQLSTIVISRADVETNLRGQSRIKYFVLSYYYLKRVRIPEPIQPEILEMATGILATNRTEQAMDLFPFDENFVLWLANFTMRSGHFNTRMFIRGIASALKLSLHWKRDETNLTIDFAGKEDLINELAENLKEEDKKGIEQLSLEERVEEIKKKVEAAGCLSKLILSGAIDPQTTYMLDMTKRIVAEQYGIMPLSDIELLAYTRKSERTKVNEMIKKLKKASVSKRAEASLEDWILKKLRSIS